VKRKIREVIKEDKGEKDSLLNDFKIKSQAAMEYLMTYGWAILIIALTLAVLYSLGIMNPKNFLPRSPPGSCFVFRPNGPGTTDFVSLQGTCGYLPMYVASFNGVNGYINCGNNTNLKLYDKSFTLQAWIKPATNIPTGSRFTVLAYYNPGWIMDLPDDSNVEGYRFYNGSIDYKYAPPSGLVSLEWTQFVVVRDLSTNTLSIYLNGNIKQSWSMRLVGNSPNPLLIGRRTDGYYFNGFISNVQIYNTALTPQEIQYLYQQGLGGGPIRLGSLVGWWPLNGDAKDYSGNNNHGTINGGVTFVQNYNPP
jgi:hypothetical protein